VVTLDRAGTITGLNPAAAEILGLDPEEVVGQPYGVVFFSLQENDAFNQLVLDLVAEQETRHYAEVPFTRDDGESRYLAMTTALLRDGRNQRLGAVLVFMDITQTHLLRAQRDQLARDLEAKHKELSEAYLELEQRNQNLREAQRRALWIKLGAGVLALLLVLAPLWWLWGRGQAGAPEAGFPEAGAPRAGGGETAAAEGGLRRFEARTGTLRRTVSCRGFIEPLVTVTVTAQVAGRVEERRVKLGQRVAEGEVLLLLSRDQVEPKVRAAEAALLKARQQVAEIESWARRPEFKQAGRRLELARLDLKRKTDRLQESERLYEEGIIPLNELDNARADLRRAQADVAEAQERLVTVRERGSEDKLRVARLELMNAEAELEEAREKLAHTTVRSPADGVVMRPPGKDENKTERIPERGDKVEEGRALMSVGARQPLGVEASVDEVAVRLVRPGQKALVSGPALGGEPLEGGVRSVAPQASLEGQVPVFPVMIELRGLPPEQARGLRLGMSASVRIVVQEQEDAVLVPVVAVSRRGGEEKVRVPGAEGPVWRQVRTGLSEAEFIQIREGLAPGQVVLY
jgi:PAS domain S-box-containing protein